MTKEVYFNLSGSHLGVGGGRGAFKETKVKFRNIRHPKREPTLITGASTMNGLCLLYAFLQEQESGISSGRRVTQSSTRALVTSRFEPLIETQFGALAEPDQNSNQHFRHTFFLSKLFRFIDWLLIATNLGPWIKSAIYLDLVSKSLPLVT